MASKYTLPAFIIFFLILTNSCLKEDELKKPFISYQPKAMDDGWQLSAPGDEGINAAALTEIYSDFHSNPDIWQVRSLLIFRNGKLVAESYTKDENDRTNPRALWSATKQVMGILTGIALEQGVIDDIDDPISKYLPETDQFADKKDITIRDLLSMRSGIAYNNDGLSGQTDNILRQLPDHINEFILGLPLDHAPGDTAIYKDCDPQLVASLIQAQCGKPLKEWASEVMFDKLGIKHLEWDTYKDGVTLGGFGILTTPREFAKFGQCVLDSGYYKSQYIVSRQWISEMTTPGDQLIYDTGFGFLWWKDIQRNMIFMGGHGGQYVIVVPDSRLLIVMTAEPNTQGDFQFNRKEAFEWVDRIVAAVN